MWPSRRSRRPPARPDLPGAEAGQGDAVQAASVESLGHVHGHVVSIGDLDVDFRAIPAWAVERPPKVHSSSRLEVWAVASGTLTGTSSVPESGALTSPVAVPSWECPARPRAIDS